MTFSKEAAARVHSIKFDIPGNFTADVFMSS